MVPSQVTTWGGIAALKTLWFCRTALLAVIRIVLAYGASRDRMKNPPVEDVMRPVIKKCRTAAHETELHLS